jgi:bifunctional non-homologous end joining protein LigD
LAVACDDSGITAFERIRHRHHDGSVFLYAFDLLELSGDDLRREPLEVRKATLISVLAKAGSGFQFNEHMECEEGDEVFRHACKLGLEGIVSKRKVPATAAAVPRTGREAGGGRREAEEDWGR